MIDLVISLAEIIKHLIQFTLLTVKLLMNIVYFTATTLIAIGLKAIIIGVISVALLYLLAKNKEKVASGAQFVLNLGVTQKAIQGAKWFFGKAAKGYQAIKPSLKTIAGRIQDFILKAGTKLGAFLQKSAVFVYTRLLSPAASAAYNSDAAQKASDLINFLHLKTFLLITAGILFLVGPHFGASMLAPAAVLCGVIYLKLIFDKIHAERPEAGLNDLFDGQFEVIDRDIIRPQPAADVAPANNSDNLPVFEDTPLNPDEDDVERTLSAASGA